MKKRIFLYTTLIILAGLFTFFIASVLITNNNNINIARNTVVETTRIFANLYSDAADLTAFAQAGGGTRITVVSADGIVLADSEPFGADGENRLDRPEIQAAASGFPAVYIRHSYTFGADMVYYALRVNSGESYVFIRVSVPVAHINMYMRQILPLLIVLLLSIMLICLLLTRGTANRVLAPFNGIVENLRLLSRGEYSPRPCASSYNEINEITKGINDVAQILQSSFDSLRDEKNKLAYILNNIGDGLFVVDKEVNITLANDIALGIFGAAPNVISKKLNYLTNEKTLENAVEDCVNNANGSLFEFVLNGKIYLVTVKRLPIQPDTELTMVVLSDVTENRENAKRQEEFFTNASHELKTPLTAIKGFNELTAINNKDNSLNKYINSITRESSRMMSLICDMLKLSELENTETPEAVPVSLAKIIDEARETISPAFNEKSIVFESKGEAEINSKPEHIYELVKNLIENAVRYNNHGGKISVNIISGKNFTRLIVSDNGIGISPKEQTRIFERFYRVEKSRSTASGGTGLGLSIVKHICSLYGWDLSLKSKLGVGTEVIINFNKN